MAQPLAKDRDLGVLGESTLRTWCAQVGIVANRSENDKKGWDFILQFPPATNAESFKVGSADLTPPELCCFIQVKATDSKRRNNSIPLSHWKRHIDSPYPVFFLILEFDGADHPQRAYFVELNRAWAEKALKRLRKLPEDKLHSTHKKTLNLNWSDSDKIGDLDGKGLATKIHKLVGANVSQYITDKLTWSKTLGYEQRPFHVSVTFKAEDIADNYRRLVSFSLGDIDHLEVESVRAEEVRFGISKKLSKPDMASGAKLSIATTPSLDVKFTLSDQQNQRMVTLQGKAFIPGLLFPFIPRQYWRMRIITKCTKFEWATGVQGGHFSFSLPDPNEKLTISDWLRLSVLLDILVASQSSGFKIEASFNTGSVTFEKIADFRVSGPENIEILRAVLSALKSVANYASLDTDWALSTLELLHQKPQLDMLRSAIDGTPADISATVFQKDLPEEYQGGKTALFSICGFRINRHVLCGFMSLSGSAQKTWRKDEDAWELTLKPERPNIHSFVILDECKLKSYKFGKRLKQHAKELGDAVELSLIPERYD